MISFEITQEFVTKLLEVVDAGLVSGVGKPIPGQMCVEAAVCYAMGLPHGDNPTCVHPAIRSLKIRLNDSCWSSNEARAKGMRKLAILQLGTAGIDFPEKEFSERVFIGLVNKIVSKTLYREQKPGAAKACEKAVTFKEAKAAYPGAVTYPDAYAYAAYAGYADYAAASAAADYAAAADAVLLLFAQLVEDILIDLNVPAAAFVKALP